MTIGIGIISFDRPQYLRRLLASLEVQRDRQSHDEVEVHLFQDGAVNRFGGAVRAEQEDVDACVRLFERTRLPNKTAHVRTENVSIGINQFEAVEWLAERYERIAVIEDDVVLSPHWLRLARVLFGELEQRDDTFSFSLGFKRECSIEEVPDKLDVVRFGTPHWWAECFTAENWRRIRPYFMEYYDIIRGIDYAKIPSGRVLELFRKHGWPQTATSQDGGKDMAIHAAGLRRAVTVVNRGISIGREGIHWTPEKFKAKGYAGQTPYIHAGDAELEGFRWA